MNNITISKDKSKLDVAFIHNFLTQAYWAKGRSIEEVRTTIEHSICYGVYKEGKQIGFARIVSDRSVFAYLMDVFILDSERGHGYGQQLMKYILNDPELEGVKGWSLKTSDAHSLYKKFGFKGITDPELYMVLVSS